MIPAYHDIIRTSIEIYVKRLLDCQRGNLWKFILNNVINDFIPDPNQQGEIMNILNFNNIDPIRFANCVKIVLSKSDPKINSLRMYGDSNSCKSLLSNALCRPFVCCYMNNHGSENEFYLSNMLNKSILLCEELYITVATCEDFKSVLGGQPIDVAKKYNEKQLLKRTPVIITSNYYKFGRGHLPAMDEDALNNRCFNFTMNFAYKPQCYIDTPNVYYFLSQLVPLDVAE